MNPARRIAIIAFSTIGVTACFDNQRTVTNGVLSVCQSRDGVTVTIAGDDLPPKVETLLLYDARHKFIWVLHSKRLEEAGVGAVTRRAIENYQKMVNDLGAPLGKVHIGVVPPGFVQVVPRGSTPSLEPGKYTLSIFGTVNSHIDFEVD